MLAWNKFKTKPNFCATKLNQKSTRTTNPNPPSRKPHITQSAHIAYSHPIDTSVKIHFLKSEAPVFVYHFTYRGQHSLTHLKLNSHPVQIEKTDMHYGVANGKINLNGSNNFQFFYPR